MSCEYIIKEGSPSEHRCHITATTLLPIERTLDRLPHNYCAKHATVMLQREAKKDRPKCSHVYCQGQPSEHACTRYTVEGGSCCPLHTSAAVKRLDTLSCDDMVRESIAAAEKAVTLMEQEIQRVGRLFGGARPHSERCISLTGTITGLTQRMNRTKAEIANLHKLLED